jgi:hypothetical protein
MAKNAKKRGTLYELSAVISLEEASTVEETLYSAYVLKKCTHQDKGESTQWFKYTRDQD